MKLKTHRGARKRFKITATGKIKRMHSGKRHLLGTKKARPHAQTQKADAGEQGRHAQDAADAALRLLIFLCSGAACCALSAADDCQDVCSLAVSPK